MLVEVQVVAPQWAATLVRQCREGGKELVQGQADPSTFPIAFLEQCCYQACIPLLHASFSLTTVPKSTAENVPYRQGGKSAPAG